MDRHSYNRVVTSEEYWRMFKMVRGDVLAAIGCNSTYLTINRLAAEGFGVAVTYNLQAEFWTATTYGLQTGFFMALGRIFDQRKDAYSIEDVVEQTIDHPGFFAKSELRKRLREAQRIYGDQPDPDTLAARVANAWEPSRSDLAILRKELKPHVKKFIEVYEPIRHQYFAHRGKASEEVIAELFSKAFKSEMAEILRFVYGVICGIEKMAINATPPGQWSDKDYDNLSLEYAAKTEEVVKRLT
jgi:hypothetical protein